MPASSPVIVVNNVWSRISGVRDLHLIDRLDHALSYAVEGAQFTRAYKHGFWDKKSGQMRFWDGRRHLLNQSMVFPTGLLQRVLSFFESAGVDIEIDDRRGGAQCGESLALKKFVPRPYQRDALERAVESGRGIIRIGTGGGKTALAAFIAARYNLPTMIYVVGRDILHQFHETFKDILGEDRVGIIGDGLCNVRQINICSIWTAVKAFDLKGKVSLDDEDWSPDVAPVEGRMKQEVRGAVERACLAIFDEAHFLACETVQSIFKASKKCRYVFGMSGTDWRDDGADLLLESVCGSRIFNMPASRLIDEGWLVPPKISFIKVPRFEKSLPKDWRTVYSRYVTHNEIRNQLVADGARTLVAMGRKPLILVRYLQHGKNLVDMMPDLSVFFVNGKIDSQARAEAKRRFEAGDIDCLVASSVFDIGVDIPSLDALIMAGGGKSTVRVLQRIGRVIRPFEGKSDALVMDFLDHARYLEKHSATRFAVYETEPRFRVKLPAEFDRRHLKKVHLKAKIR